MKEDKVKTVAVIVGLCAVIDFGTGYMRTRSLSGALVWIVLGLISTALFIWLYYKKTVSTHTEIRAVLPAQMLCLRQIAYRRLSND